MDARSPRPTPPRVGERWTFRVREADGSARDVLGWVTSVSSTAIKVEQRDVTETVDAASLLLARRVPAAAGGLDPLRTSPAELQQLSAPAWIGDSAPLGEWILRSAAGFTGRANSCLAVGDPGLPYAAAAEQIIEYAAQHQIPPMAQVVAGSVEAVGLTEAGWQATYVPTEVLVTRLGQLLGDTVADPQVKVAGLDDAWWAAYQRNRPTTAPEAVVRRVITGADQDQVGLAQITAADGTAIAIGRGHLSPDPRNPSSNQNWLGIAAVWVDPTHLRQGMGTQVLLALGHWAARRGARNVYLQVESANEPALAAYAKAGFTHHHNYLYLAPA